MLIHVPTMAAAALGLKAPALQDVADPNCAFCGTPLSGKGVPVVFGLTFVDYALLADRSSKSACGSCTALRHRTAMTAASASGCVTEDGFSRLLSREERLGFLMNPPCKPFAVGIVNAQQQHVWWHTPASYDRDFFVIRYGARTLDVDRLAAIKVAEKIRTIEADATKYARVFYSPTKNLKAQHDGHLKTAFIKDDSPEAAALKSLIVPLSFGTWWAAQQLLMALRKYDTLSLNEAATMAANARKSA